MPIAEPRGSKKKPRRMRILDALIVIVVMSGIIGSVVFDMWQSAVGRRWMVGWLIVVPVLITLRKHTSRPAASLTKGQP
jgi:hypothetical protein